ncbi:hypothetical protein QBC39DRAFT_436769 [Podospora conica]|nr:hypothetical protein QBC39DRAFT_436769 [Schizothecium conicum]
MTDHCGHDHEPPVPEDIQVECAIITTKLNTYIFGHDVVKAVRALQADCMNRQVGLWTSVVESLPVPAQWIIRIIADTKPVPKACEARVVKICEYFNIDRATFDEFFLGGSSHTFLETLSELTKDPAPLQWDATRDALDRARRTRMREMDPRATSGKLWQPLDIGHAALHLGSETFKTMKRLPKAWLDSAADSSTKGPKGGKRERPSVSPRRRRGPKKTPGGPASHGRASPALSVEHGRWAPSHGGQDASPVSSVCGTPPVAKRPRRWHRESPDSDDMFFGDFGLEEHQDTTTLPPSSLSKPVLLPSDPLAAPAAPAAPAVPATPANPSDPPTLDVIWRPGLLVDDDRQRLVAPEGWLSGTVMNLALEAVCSPTACFAVTSDVLVPTSRSENHGAYREKIRGEQAFVLPLHLGGNHWALAHLRCAAKVAAVYDSLESAGHRDEAQDIVQRFIGAFLGDDIFEWQVTAAASPQQGDSSSCGVFAIATAVHILFGRAVPSAPYRSGLWRVLVARLIGVIVEAPPPPGGRVVTVSGWPYSHNEDRQVAALPDSLPEMAMFQTALKAGTCTISTGQALAAALSKATAAAGMAMAAKIKRAIQEREQTLGELRAVGALVDAARAATAEAAAMGEDGGDRARAARFVAQGGLGAYVEESIRDGMASVKWLAGELDSARASG